MSEVRAGSSEVRVTATEVLRRLLKERGVEWRGGLPTETMVEADGLDLLYVALPDGRVRAFIRNYLTPEQAVEATLGDADATGERQRDAVEVVRCKDCERIADELEAWCDRVDVDGDACDVPRDLAKRIRRLAAKDE